MGSGASKVQSKPPQLCLNPSTTNTPDPPIMPCTSTQAEYEEHKQLLDNAMAESEPTAINIATHSQTRANKPTYNISARFDDSNYVLVRRPSRPPSLSCIREASHIMTINDEQTFSKSQTKEVAISYKRDSDKNTHTLDSKQHAARKDAQQSISTQQPHKQQDIQPSVSNNHQLQDNHYQSLKFDKERFRIANKEIRHDLNDTTNASKIPRMTSEQQASTVSSQSKYLNATDEDLMNEILEGL
ncbi:hypothetical protein BDV3_005945 [Batrachochytrium dendrobatidis]